MVTAAQDTHMIAPVQVRERDWGLLGDSLMEWLQLGRVTAAKCLQMAFAKTL